MDYFFLGRNLHKYAISKADVYLRKKADHILIRLNIKADIEDETVDEDISHISAVIDTYIDTGMSDLSDLMGLKLNLCRPNSGLFTAAHPELIRHSSLIMNSIKDDHATLQWGGMVDVNWNAEFGTNVMFSSKFDAKIIWQ